MISLARSPPVVGLALATAAGATLQQTGVPLPWTLPAVLAAFLLNRTSPRPRFGPRILGALTIALWAGYFLSLSGDLRLSRDCRLLLPDGETLEVTGRLVGPLVEGRGELEPTGPGSSPSCHRPLRIVVPGASVSGSPWASVEAGRTLEIKGQWRRASGAAELPPLRAGYLRADSLALVSVGSKGWPRDWRLSLGGWVQGSLSVLYPEMGPVTAALVWARKDRLGPNVRETFVRAGAAHLLAISGFHVGVVAGVLVLLVSQLGLSHRIRYPLAGVGVWIYVVAIGLPDAAVRGALILTLVAAGRAAGRPVAPLGALATAFLAYFVVDPGALGRPGFQLSFAGAGGLIVGYGATGPWLRRRVPAWVPAFVSKGISAGFAATMATLPLVAWHFGRVSLVGIPVTLAVTPLVALAIPGIFLTLLLFPLHQGLAQFLAGGVETLLFLFLKTVGAGASLPFASVWVPRVGVLAVAAFTGGAFLVLAMGPSLPAARRRRTLAWAALAGILLGTPGVRVLSLGTMEIVALDVGQGDAILIRSPGGRWVLVDTGPRTSTFDAGASTVLPYLRQRAIGRVEVLVLTHPDMDHVGGAASVLDEIQVGRVLGPGLPTGTQAYLEALAAAKGRGVPWQAVQAGDSLNLDGMALRVLGPGPGDLAPGAANGANQASVVLEIRFAGFSAILTGDAPVTSEESVVPGVLSPFAQVLKVGHHGSRTSTSPALLERIRPEVALISVGRRNRFGHPDPGVLARLSQADSRVYRTDRNGDITVRVRGDGSYRISTEFR